MNRLKDLSFPKSYADAFTLFAKDRIKEQSLPASLEQMDIHGLITSYRQGTFDGEKLQDVLQLGKILATPNRPLSLQLQPYFHMSIHGSVGLSVITAPNASAGLLSTLEHFDLLMPAMSFELIDRGNYTTIPFKPKMEISLVEDLMELIVGCFTSILPYLPQESLPVDVHFKHESQFDIEQYKETWKITGDINFGSDDNYVIIPNTFLASELSTSNQTSHAIVSNLLKEMKLRKNNEQSTVYQVRGLVENMLEEKSTICLNKVAEKLNMSTRTLSRRLQNEGGTFGQVYSDVRNQKAQNMLRHTQQPVTQIAVQCGYANVASFSKAFSKENSISPLQYRKKMTALSASRH